MQAYQHISCHCLMDPQGSQTRNLTLTIIPCNTVFVFLCVDVSVSFHLG